MVDEMNAIVLLSVLVLAGERRGRGMSSCKMVALCLLPRNLHLHGTLFDGVASRSNTPHPPTWFAASAEGGNSSGLCFNQLQVSSSDEKIRRLQSATPSHLGGGGSAGDGRPPAHHIHVEH